MKANLYFNQADATDSTITFDVHGAIGDDVEGVTAKQFAQSLQEMAGKDVVLRINSPGGVVADALQIYDLLSQHNGKVETQIYGASASAATIISQAGTRKMSANALMLVHHAWGMHMGNKFALQSAIKDLEQFDKRILSIYTAKGANGQHVANLMAENEGNGRWMDAEEALRFGLIDQIIPSNGAKALVDAQTITAMGLPALPEGAPVQAKKTPSKAELKIITAYVPKLVTL